MLSAHNSSQIWNLGMETRTLLGLPPPPLLLLICAASLVMIS